MTATRFLTRARAALLLLSAATAGACGDAKAPGASGGNGNGGGNGNTNSGADDGGASGDATMGDAAAGPGDASMDGDASTGGSGGAIPQCDLEPEQLTVKIDGRGSHTWDALQVGNTIHLAYEIPVCNGMPQYQAQRLDYLTFGSTGKFGAAEPVVNYADGTCYFTRSPTLAPGDGDVPVLFYTTNAVDTSELYEKQLGSASPALRLTNDGSLSDAEEHAVAVPFGPNNLLAYANSYTYSQQGPQFSSIVTRRVGNPEQPILSWDLQEHISDLSLAAFGPSNALGGVLAWVVDIGDKPAISAQLLNKDGTAKGKAVTLTEQVGTFSNVRIAMLPGAAASLAGAVVYGVSLDELRTELRFRTIGQDGSFGDEVQLTTGNVNAQGVGIAPFGNGYILAFRVIAAGATSIVVKAIDANGNTAALAERVLVGADTSGTPPKVFVTNDGRITVVFSNINGDGTTLRAVRAVCDP